MRPPTLEEDLGPPAKVENERFYYRISADAVLERLFHKRARFDYAQALNGKVMALRVTLDNGHVVALEPEDGGIAVYRVVQG